MGKGAKHRLSQNDFVMNIYGLFSDEYESTPVKSIWEISLDVKTIIERLEKKYDVTYSSEIWVWTQLKRYEQDLGVKLFRKIKADDGENNFSVALNYPYLNFFQKKHLFVNEKIKVANGIYDKIIESIRFTNKNKPINIFLGAGTLCYHLATIIAGSEELAERKVSIFTNNLGALTKLITPGECNPNMEIIIPEGRIDQVTYTITGSNETMTENNFDYIIQGTSCVCDGELYIESTEEQIRKKAILKKTSGMKILALTKKEFSAKPIENSIPYGNVSDYDYLIVPKKGSSSEVKKKYEELFETLSLKLTPEIINWNYEIYKVKN